MDDYISENGRKRSLKAELRSVRKEGKSEYIRNGKGEIKYGKREGRKQTVKERMKEKTEIRSKSRESWMEANP